jgi:GxxExxY protein
MKVEPSRELDSIMRLVIGAAIEVHRRLGPGLLEALYEKALCIELTERKVKHVRQFPVEVKYKKYVIGENRLDLLVENSLIVELKSVDCLAPIHIAQLIAYLKCTGYRLGLLINFNVPLLRQGIKRIVLS